MIPILLLAAAAPVVPADLKACTNPAAASPAAALGTADAWLSKGGGLDARLCRAAALAGLERWGEAAAAFEALAAEAEKLHDLRRADFLVQAGNAWLAAEQPAKARQAFDAALATTLLAPPLRGEVHLDRARAAVAAGDLAAGRADLDKALQLVPGDAFAWYLSAALARRQNDLKRARTEIAKAVGLAPDEAPILLEAGNIAGLSGEIEAAKGLYEQAARAAPASEAGRAAQAALAANGGAAPPQPPQPR